MNDVTALVPPHGLGRPGEAIPLYDGAVTWAGRSAPGSVQLQLAPRPDVRWSAKHPFGSGLGDVELHLDHETGPVRANARRNRMAEGSIPHAEVGSADAALDHVLAHWLNLPSFGSSHPIEDGPTGYPGRWTAELGAWTVTIDRRRDHREVYREITAQGSIVSTHVMEIRRRDGLTFPPSDIDPLLDALHLGMSFALGRWVAPVLPVGFARNGARVWEQWAVRRCDPGAAGALSWWFRQHERELAELLNLLVVRFDEPARRFTTRFLLAGAVLSAAGGFCEQRIMTAVATLEHLTWTTLVMRGSMSTSAYKKLTPTSERLALLLDAAAIDVSLDSSACPDLAAFAHEQPAGERSGPRILHKVRNMIVHPTSDGHTLYERFDGLVTEAWLLAHHYLVLLVLHDLGYRGSAQRILRPGGWEGDVEAVPWVR